MVTGFQRYYEFSVWYKQKDACLLLTCRFCNFWVITRHFVNCEMNDIMYLYWSWICGKIIVFGGDSGRNPHEAAKIYIARFPDRNRPDHKVELKVILIAQKTGQGVRGQKHPGGRQREVHTEENRVATINASFFSDKHVSYRQGSA